MNKMLVIIGGLLIIVILISCSSGSEKNKNIFSNDSIFISSRSQTNERVRSLNLDEASEDASYILDTNKLVFSKIKKETHKQTDYKPDSKIEWTINLKLVNGGKFTQEDLIKLFDLTWRENYSSTIYGHLISQKRWTYALGTDKSEFFDGIQIGVNILEVFNEENSNYDSKKLERYISELEKRIQKYPLKLSIEPTEQIVKAIEKGKKLVQLNHEFNEDAIIVLKSDNTFKGTLAWDALLCVGLKWGDGDLFHWENNQVAGYGDQTFFSVWTTTEPGYFLPENIKDGQMNPKDLVFGFQIPRSADPQNIFNAMINSVKYCQKRLGGTILDKNGQPFNEVEEKKHLSEIIERMKAKGLTPGSENVLILF
jgi:cell division protein ZipA